ncbi:NEDD4-binding protein 2 [Geranomyces variabilis]|uniref:NEDD4-binding protein 2 n=1 Tax=Geranomyces variabilis TaxID=109894 RepID=A0AAD5XRU4_9FUNG|nr:NEDD4-binding protein 2 [Geranomyces variabilis]
MSVSSLILYILRGAPGSGKSTLARSLSQTHVFSTDDFFVCNETGVYKFDATQIGRAHEWNQHRAKMALAEKIPVVVIDNTNMCRWEAKPYVEAALHEGYAIEIKEPATDWWVARDVATMAKRNTHGVDAEIIERMIARYEPDFSISSILAAEPPFPPQQRQQRPQQPFTPPPSHDDARTRACIEIAARLRRMGVLSEAQILEATTLAPERTSPVSGGFQSGRGPRGRESFQPYDRRDRN